VLHLRGRRLVVFQRIRSSGSSSLRYRARSSWIPLISNQARPTMALRENTDAAKSVTGSSALPSSCDVDRCVDRKLDAFLADKMGEDEFQQFKAMTKKGEPLDPETEERLREQLGDAFEPYRNVHNGVARMEQTERTIREVTSVLP
jgi:hypothetical protein